MFFKLYSSHFLLKFQKQAKNNLPGIILVLLGKIIIFGHNEIKWKQMFLLHEWINIFYIKNINHLKKYIN